ncbi:MAG: serine hydrolase domain-containing protein, partial [Pseudomonadota bacterium]
MSETIDAILAEEALVGAAWMLIADNNEISLGAVGLRDNLTQSAFSIDTSFHVGSLTKSLLATGVLRLATEGQLELDAPVTRYLPRLRFDNPWRETTEVSVRHLLDHTSGLADAHLWQLFSERPIPQTPLIAAFPSQEQQLAIRSKPGERFSYSNMGYTLLGMIVESVTGESYETYLDTHVLVPLGMNASTFGFTTQE